MILVISRGVQLYYGIAQCMLHDFCTCRVDYVHCVLCKLPQVLTLQCG